MNKIIKVAIIFSTSMMSASAFAAGEMKQGLWEMSTTMNAEQLAECQLRLGQMIQATLA